MTNNLSELSKLIRYFILTSTTAAGSGHPSSSLSGVELMTVLMFGGFFKADLKDVQNPNNDRLIFSKGHASPLFYALYAAAGKVSESELLKLRTFDSPLEGHPTLRFPYTEVATGSLGQGLSVGVGMALNAKYLDKMSYKTYVLLGDSEMAEGSVWEAMEIGAHYKLDNLVAILDANRLGQRGETLYGHDVAQFKKKAEAFGWEAIVVKDGNSLSQCDEAFEKAAQVKDKPVMIIAKTLKGKGVSFIENKEGWHGKPLSSEELKMALVELGDVNKKVRGVIKMPTRIKSKELRITENVELTKYPLDKNVSTRKAYGNALVNIHGKYKNMVVLDAETSNSTFAETFKKQFPEKFFEMYIAEQNMASVALGMSRRGKIPFVSTFAAFLSRAADQIRMGQYSDSNVKFVGSHAGVSIGEDGSSQMALEDLSMFKSILGSVVLYPSDAVSTERLVELAAEHHGMVYIRTTRMDTPILYSGKDNFKIGGHKVICSNVRNVGNVRDEVAVIAAGVTLHEALKAYEILKKENIFIRVIDLYSIKPINVRDLEKSLEGIETLLTVEDHYPEGGLGEAVRSALNREVHSLAVRKMSRSGKPQELLDYEEISASAIVKMVKKLIKK